METDKLKILLGKYYSGDIMPDEYQSLLSILKETEELSPELEAERRILLEIDSCETIEPEGFEERLILAIDNKRKRKRNFLKIIYSVSVAAIVMMIITIGLHFQEKSTIYQPQPIAKIAFTHETIMTERKQESLQAEAPVRSMQTASVTPKKSPLYSVSTEELEKSVQIVEEALIEVLASIQMSKNEAIEVINNIEINQITDYNIM